jgi:hypothetical protein
VRDGDDLEWQFPPRVGLDPKLYPHPLLSSLEVKHEVRFLLVSQAMTVPK